MWKYLKWAIGILVAIYILWAMSFELLGFKHCAWCGKLVRGKSEYRVLRDKYVSCNECFEQGNITKEIK